MLNQKPAKSKHYLSNKDFTKELIKSKEKNELSIEAVEMFFLIARKLSTKFSYDYFQDREDCIMRGVEDSWMYWRSFDPSRNTNAFSYFTQVIKNGMAKEFRIIHKISQKHFTSINNIYNI
jgi:DNA-directed RNA polymerase specialized sigma subunit